MRLATNCVRVVGMGRSGYQCAGLPYVRLQVMCSAQLRDIHQFASRQNSCDRIQVEAVAMTAGVLQASVLGGAGTMCL